MKSPESPTRIGSDEEAPFKGEVLGVLDYEIVKKSAGRRTVRETLIGFSVTGEPGFVNRSYDIDSNDIKYTFQAFNDVEVGSKGQEHHTTNSTTLVEDGGSGQEEHTTEESSGISYSSIRDLPQASPGTRYESTRSHLDEAYEGGTDRSDGDGNSIRMPRGVTVSTEGLDERDARLVPSEKQIEGLLPLYSRKDKRSARLIIEKLRNYGLGSDLPQVETNQVIKWSARRSGVILPAELKRVMLHSGDDSKPSTLTAVGRSTNCPELGIAVSPRGRRGLDIAISNGSEIVLIRKGVLGTRLEVSSNEASSLLVYAESILMDDYNWGAAAGAIRSKPL